MYRQHMLIGGFVFATRLESSLLFGVRKKINDFKSLVFVKWFEVEFYTNTFILQKQHYFWLEWSMVIKNCVFYVRNMLHRVWFCFS